MKHLVRRILQAVFTLFAVVSLSFGLIRLLPGGPMDYLRAKLAQQSGASNPERVDQLMEVYTNVHPQKPILVQYVEYMASIAQGDFGRSLWYNAPVADILGEALPWTVLVMSLSLFATFLLGIALGAIMAYQEGSVFDISSTIGFTFLSSIPYYVAGVVMLYVLAYQFPIFPTGGRMDQSTTVGFNLPYVLGVLHHAALPVLSMVLTGFGGQALAMRGNSIRVLGEDYLRVARLRGLSQRRIALKYVAQNAILPMYTSFMISIGFMFGGSVILEKIFQYHGIGYYMFEAVNSRDYPLMMGGFLLITIAVIVGIFIADLTYGKIDPRAGGESRETY